MSRLLHIAEMVVNNWMKLSEHVLRTFLKGIIIKCQDTSIFPYGFPPHCSSRIK